MVKTLIVLPGRVEFEEDPRVASDERGRMEIPELTKTLQRQGVEVEFLNYDHVSSDRNFLVKLVARFLGLQYAQAVSAFFRLGRYDSVLTYGESAGAPLALFVILSRLLFWRRATRHVCVVYDLTKPGTAKFFRTFRAYKGIAIILVPSQEQRRFCMTELGVEADRLVFLPCSVDTRFYRVCPKTKSETPLLVSAGASMRDYATLVNAMKGLPELRLKIDPSAGPRLNKKTIPDAELSENTEYVHYPPGGLRDLYMGCDIFCVSVFGGLKTTYGVTTALEGMAMGKPVVATRIPGLTDYLIEGETGLFVEPGDVEGWRRTLRRLSQDPALCERLGRNGRQWAEKNATIELWAERVAAALLPKQAPQLSTSKVKAGSEPALS